MILAQAECRLDGRSAKEAVSKALHGTLDTGYGFIQAGKTSSNLGMESGELGMPVLDTDFDFLADSLDFGFFEDLFASRS